MKRRQMPYNMTHVYHTDEGGGGMTQKGILMKSFSKRNLDHVA